MTLIDSRFVKARSLLKSFKGVTKIIKFYGLKTQYSKLILSVLPWESILKYQHYWGHHG